MDKTTALELLKSLQAQQAALAQQQAALLAALAGDEDAPPVETAPLKPPKKRTGRRRSRSRTDGGIEKLPSGRWRARLELDADPRTGERKRKSKSFDTLEAAQKWLQDEKKMRNEGTAAAPTQITLEKHLKEWLETVVTVKARERTRVHYSNISRLYILPDLGSTKLQALRPETVQAHVAILTGRGLSAPTVRYTITLLKSALETAVEWGRLTRNPVHRIKLPPKPRQERPQFDPAALRAFLRDVVEGPYGVLIAVAVTSGMRAGETQGLMWDAVDFERNTLNVKRALEWVRGDKAKGTRWRWQVKEPKTASGTRIVTMPAWAMEMLAHHKQEQDLHRQRLGEMYEDNGFVFTNAWGRPFRSTVIARDVLKPALAKHGLPEMSFAKLRRIAPTLLLAAGKSPRMASERLGHADPTITLAVYSHLHAGAEQEAADTLGDMLDPRKSRLTHVRPTRRKWKHGT